MNRPRPISSWLLAFAVAATVGLGVVGCGGGSDNATARQGESAATESTFAGSEARPRKQAPRLRLDDSLGKAVNLADYRGKAVLVTFIYTHCPDICPLIVSHLKTAQAELGPKARDLQIVAVSTDPRGDTPKTVAAFLKAHGMTGRMQYLIGTRPELGRVWADWNIVAKPLKAGRDFVEHSALVYGVAADGKITTLYPANFAPSQIVHDVPLLERR
ncbi:MAG: SCO family protein [Solirubrobacterales bacterium]